MKHLNVCTCSLIAIALLCLSATVVLPEEGGFDVESVLTPQNLARLEKGEVVLVSQSYEDENGAMRARGAAAVMVDATPDEVWTYLSDFESLPSYMPRMVAATRYLDEGTTVGMEFTVKVVFRKVTYHILHTIDREAGTLALRLDASRKNDIADVAGLWVVRPHEGGRTLLAHSIVLDSGLPVPRVLEDYLTRKDLPDIVTRLKKRVESGGQYAKKGR